MLWDRESSLSTVTDHGHRTPATFLPAKPDEALAPRGLPGCGGASGDECLPIGLLGTAAATSPAGQGVGSTGPGAVAKEDGAGIVTVHGVMAG